MLSGGMLEVCSFSNSSSSNSPDHNHVTEWPSVLSYKLTLPICCLTKALNWNTATLSKMLRSRRLYYLDITGSLFTQTLFSVQFFKNVPCFAIWKLQSQHTNYLMWKQATVLMGVVKSLCLLANGENWGLCMVSKDSLTLDSPLYACL